MKRSRLSRKLENETKKNLFLSILGIVVVITLLLKFGFPLLVNLSLFLANSKSNSQDSTSKNSDSFIPPPVLDPLNDATNSAKIIISGKGSKEETIKLYINDSFSDKTTVDKNGNFVFKNVELSNGANEIKVKAVTKENKDSGYSNTYSINYNNKPPILTVDQPSDGAQFSKDQSPINVSGNTDPGNRVTVNGFWAIVGDDGRFSYSLKLNNGDNAIKIEVTDQAGNQTSKDIKVNYSS